MLPLRSPRPRPRCPHVGWSWRDIAVLDDKVPPVLVKLGHLAGQKNPEGYLRGLVAPWSQAAAAEPCTVYIVNGKKKEPWARRARPAQRQRKAERKGPGGR